MTVTLDVPRSMYGALGAVTDAEAAAALRLAAAVKLYELGKLSSGAAAELAGLHRVAFLERLADFDVSPFQQTPQELEHDVETLRSHGG